MKFKPFVLFAALLFAGAAYSEEEVVSKATEAQTRDFIVEVWSKCSRYTVTDDGDKMTVTYHSSDDGIDYISTFSTADIGRTRVTDGDDGALILLCRPEEPECIDILENEERDASRRNLGYYGSSCPGATYRRISKAFDHLIRLHDETRPKSLF